MSFEPGIVALLSEHRYWIAGKRVGLVSHSAAVDARGRTSAELLRRARDVKLTCLLGPEHGFDIRAGAGVPCQTITHRSWSIPVYSLYGKTRKPTRAMLRHVDTLVFDIQNLAVRPYTYVSTLRLVLEAAAEADKEVIVADRPIPLPSVIDGPVTRKGFASFVSSVDTPMCYGMTPGETALWLRKHLCLDLRLKVAKMSGYHRQTQRGAGWPPWVPPSPAIICWKSAMCYPATVFSEAFPSIDHGRCTRMPFQVIGGPWMKAAELRDHLTDFKLPGTAFWTCKYAPGSGPLKGKQLPGIRIDVSDPNSFRPILTAVTIIHCLQQAHGKDKLWNEPGTRPDCFDKLFGTDKVRLALLDGERPNAIASQWKRDLTKFNVSREKCLLYPPPAPTHDCTTGCCR